MPTVFARVLRNITLLIGALGFMACAGDVKTIDRTQANKVDKKIFEGEWYFRPVVVETQMNQGLMFEGLEGEMDRIRFDIRQDQLLAYRSYKTLENAQDGNGSVNYQGAPVAIFAITSHFDVQREYNAATGEQSNVLVENTTDRPWYQRQYMRVDWSRNLLTSPYSLEDATFAIGSAPYYIEDHEIDNPHRAEVTPTNINVVQNYMLNVDDEICAMLRSWSDQCAGSEVKIKLSFMKVQNRDYQPLYYPDSVPVFDKDTHKPIENCYYGAASDCSNYSIPMFERFGFFRTQRLAYDDEYRWTRNGRVFLANRWNIWKKSTDDKGVAIPLKYRTPGSFTYYANADFPVDNEIWSASKELVDNWDQTFRETVAIAKDLVPRALPTTEEGRAQRIKDVANVVPSVFRLSQNNCRVDYATQFAKEHELGDTLANYGIGTIDQGNLKRACAVLESTSDFTWQKDGDLRYSFLHWVTTPQNNGPLGYGPSGADPITGELISANANIYGSAVNSYASYAADVVAVMNGDLTIDSLVKGENIRDAIERAGRPLYGDYSQQKVAQLQTRISNTVDTFRARQKKPTAQDVSTMLAFKARLDSADLQQRIAAYAKSHTRARLNRLAGSPIDKEILGNDELKRAMLGPEKYQPGQDTGAGFTPLKTMVNDLDLGKNDHALMMRLMEHSITMAEWADDGMAALAMQLQGKKWEEVYSYMRREIYRSVMAHEVGHTIGLRHNFEGSMDALNYNPKFWDSYDKNTEQVKRVDAQGKPTDAELYMYSSIMDYDARFYADSLKGIGAYDQAAIKFAYGNLLETFQPDVPALYYDTLLFLYDYTKIPKIVSGENTCPTTDVVFTHTTAINCKALGSLSADGAWGYMKKIMDKATPRVENIWKRTYVDFDEYLKQQTAYYNEQERNFETGAPFNVPAEVPYKFCSDEYSGYSNVSCQPYDKGANFREITADRMQRYNAYYFFNNFKRDRYSFNDYDFAYTYMSRLISRFFGQMSNVYRYHLYGYQTLGADASGKMLTLNDFDVGDTWTKASLDGLNYITSVLQQPNPGDYCLDAGTNTYRPMQQGASCVSPLNVPVGVGKYYLTKWTDEYNYKATVLGTFYDKYAAIWALTDNEGYFYQNFSDTLDAGAFALSYWRGMKDEMLNVLTPEFTGVTSPYALKVLDTSGAPQFVSPPAVDIYNSNIDFNALPAIESATSWTLRYYSMALAMARFNSMYDYTEDFAHFSRVCLDGYKDCQALGHIEQQPGGSVVVLDGQEGVDYTAFVDPTTGYKYIASGTPSEKGAIGALLLADANKFITTRYNPAYAAWKAAKDHVDALVASGAPQQQIADAQLEMNSAEATLSGLERQLHERTSTLDIVRQLADTMEYGNSNM